MKFGTTESTFNKQKQILFITLHQQNYVIFFIWNDCSQYKGNSGIYSGIYESTGIEIV